jgi:replication factor C subunit 1
LWTVKYAPKNLGDLCGNKTQIDKIQAWLRDWSVEVNLAGPPVLSHCDMFVLEIDKLMNDSFRSKFRRSNFTKPGKDGLGMYRCVVLSGPPGVGKTSAAHLVAQAEGYEVIELNASDTRSKKLLETGFKDIIVNSSIAGFLEVNRPLQPLRERYIRKANHCD